jgi:hypothetical protein
MPASQNDFLNSIKANTVNMLAVPNEGKGS